MTKAQIIEEMEFLNGSKLLRAKDLQEKDRKGYMKGYRVALNDVTKLLKN